MNESDTIEFDGRTYRPYRVPLSDLPPNIRVVFEALDEMDLPPEARKLIEQIPTYIRILAANARKP